jgi:hypothetical protein
MGVGARGGDGNAETCVVTGDVAHARVEGSILRGWYGSTVIDGETFVVRAGALPPGPVSDDVIRKALASGGVYDPERLLAGEVEVEDVPDDVVLALVAAGVADAVRKLARTGMAELALHVPPVFRVEMDEPVGVAASAALFGRPRHRGVDLVGVGELGAMARLARGLEADPDAIARGVLDGIKARAEILRSLGGEG